MSKTTKILLSLLFIGGALVLGIGASFFILNKKQISSLKIVQDKKPKELPLLKYAIANLKNFPFQIGQIKIEEKIADYDEHSAYVFSYASTGGKISGQINLPKEISPQAKIIILVRGYVDPEIYETGVGTKSAADVFAKNGYITLSPDFLGFGLSDSEPTDSWEARFIKPVNVIELLRVAQKTNFPQVDCEAKLVGSLSLKNDENKLTQNIPSVCEKTNKFSNQIGFWAHSNGGQVALTVLEALSESIPTTLWAPVTVPFPYSILFFSDESPDEGKAMRKWLAQFEADYDVFDFTVSQNLDKLRGILQLHHGTTDEAALWVWSQEFVDKVTVENQRRADEIKTLNQSLKEASLSAQTILELESKKMDLKSLGEIKLDFFSYPGADHNLRPSWNEVITRDLEFFKLNL